MVLQLAAMLIKQFHCKPIVCNKTTHTMLSLFIKLNCPYISKNHAKYAVLAFVFLAFFFS